MHKVIAGKTINFRAIYLNIIIRLSQFTLIVDLGAGLNICTSSLHNLINVNQVSLDCSTLWRASVKTTVAYPGDVHWMLKRTFPPSASKTTDDILWIVKYF